MAEALPDILQRQQDQTGSPGFLNTSRRQQSSRGSAAVSVTPPDGVAVGAFVAFMRSRRRRPKIWVNAIPLPLLQLSEHDMWSGRTHLVQIEGHGGSQCIQFKRRLEGPVGGVTLQALESFAANVDREQLASWSIGLQIHDISEDQPVQGAKLYYLKNVLHDFSDERCIDVLWRLRLACAADTLVLIDEMVVPDDATLWNNSQHGLQMARYLVATERSQAQWTNLLATAGVQLRQVYTYDLETRDSVLVATKG